MSVPGHVVASSDFVATPSMSFRAIFAGWFIATGIAGLLYVGGLALGFSSFDAWDAADSAKGIGIGSAIWVVLTWIVSLFLGGMFASWFDGRNDETSGTVHGLAVWGVAMVATGIWIAGGLSHTLSGHGAMGAAHRSGLSASHHNSPMAEPAAVMILDASISRVLSQGGQHSRDASKPVTAALIAGQDDTATALIAADTGATETDASGAVSGLAPEIQAAKREAKAAADRVAHYAAITLWIVFASALLAMLAAAFGGWLGAAHVHRVYHLRNYPARHPVI